MVAASPLRPSGALTRRPGRRAPERARTTAMIAAVLVLVAGCSGPAKGTKTRPVAVATSPVEIPLTPESAAKAFDLWTANTDLARMSGDERLALTWMNDSAGAVTASEFRQAAFTGKPVTRYAYGKPVLYVPRIKGYPQWFVAAVTRNEEPALLAFIKKNAEDRFRLSIGTYPAKNVKVPLIDVDPEGYATPLAADDKNLLVSPQLVSSLQAAIAEDGPKSFSMRVMKAGPFTTGYYTQNQKDVKKAQKKDLQQSSVYTSTGQPIFPLRTKDGGGLVLYAMTHDVTTKQETEGPLEVPKEAQHLLLEQPSGVELRVFNSLQFAAFIPKKGAQDKKKDEDAKPAKADVIAEGGLVTRIKTL